MGEDRDRRTAAVAKGHAHEHGSDEEEKCCDGKRTAAEHRAESEDGKCCVDKDE